MSRRTSLTLPWRGRVGAKRRGEMTEGHSKPGITKFRRASAKRLRSNATELEARLWRALRNIPMLGSHFRRQVPVGPYVVDIACLAKRLIVEVDGSQHGLATNAAHDAERTRRLEAEGYRVLRFWNNDINRNLDGVLETISAAVHGDADAKWMEHKRHERTPAAVGATPLRQASPGDPPPPGEGAGP